MGEDPGRAQSMELVNKVKDLQRNNRDGKLKWLSHTLITGGGKQDPKMHTSEYILNFFKLLDAGQIEIHPSVMANQGTNTKTGPPVSGVIFVGNLPQTVTLEEIETYFRGWGHVTRTIYKEGRGFCFVSFQDARTVDTIMDHHDMHEIKGQFVDCKRAEDRRTTNADGTHEENDGDSARFMDRKNREYETSGAGQHRNHRHHQHGEPIQPFEPRKGKGGHGGPYDHGPTFDTHGGFKGSGKSGPLGGGAPVTAIPPPPPLPPPLGLPPPGSPDGQWVWVDRSAPPPHGGAPPPPQLRGHGSKGSAPPPGEVHYHSKGAPYTTVPPPLHSYPPPLGSRPLPPTVHFVTPPPPHFAAPPPGTTIYHATGSTAPPPSLPPHYAAPPGHPAYPSQDPYRVPPPHPAPPGHHLRHHYLSLPPPPPASGPHHALPQSVAPAPGYVFPPGYVPPPPQDAARFSGPEQPPEVPLSHVPPPVQVKTELVEDPSAAPTLDSVADEVPPWRDAPSPARPSFLDNEVVPPPPPNEAPEAESRGSRAASKSAIGKGGSLPPNTALPGKGAGSSDTSRQEVKQEPSDFWEQEMKQEVKQEVKQEDDIREEATVQVKCEPTSNDEYDFLASEAPPSLSQPNEGAAPTPLPPLDTAPPPYKQWSNGNENAQREMAKGSGKGMRGNGRVPIRVFSRPSPY